MAELDFFTYLNNIKRRNKLKISFFLFVIMLGFFWAFVPIGNFGIKGSYSEIFNLFVKVSASSVLSVFIAFPLFATDPLATGKGKYSKYFLQLYPSKLIAKKYNVSEGQANDLWFKFFNSWSIPCSKNNICWASVLDRTYACRLIYYATSLLRIALILSGVLIVLSLIMNKLHPGNFIFLRMFVLDFKGWFYFTAVFIVFIFFFLNNRIPSEKNKTARGCWKKYEEISKIEQAALNNEILNNCSSYEEAYRLVNDIYSNLN